MGFCSGTNAMPIRRPISGEKMIEVDSQLMRSRSGSSLSSLSVMYLEDFVFSKTVPFWASNSTSGEMFWERVVDGAVRTVIFDEREDDGID